MKRPQKGFTIIEVLIVLAIAGVIILGVLIAVPTLQRNNRNSARTSEASRIAALVRTCLSNRNGVTGSCDTSGEIQYQTSDFSQLDTAPANFVTNTATSGALSPAPGASSINQAAVVYNAQCSTDGSGGVVSSSGARSFIVLFSLEATSGTTTRCVSS